MATLCNVYLRIPEFYHKYFFLSINYKKLAQGYKIVIRLQHKESLCLEKWHLCNNVLQRYIMLHSVTTGIVALTFVRLRYEPHLECLCTMIITRRRSACASTHSDEHFGCSLPRYYNNYSCFIYNIKIRTTFDRTSLRTDFYDVAHILGYIRLNCDIFRYVK